MGLIFSYETFMWGVSSYYGKIAKKGQLLNEIYFEEAQPHTSKPSKTRSLGVWRNIYLVKAPKLGKACASMPPRECQ